MASATAGLGLDAQVAHQFARVLIDVILHVAQRVKHLDDGCPPGGAQALGHHARQPIVAVDDVVAAVVGLGVGEHACHELIQVVVDLVGFQGGLWAGGDMNHAAVGSQLMAEAGSAGVLDAGEHLDKVAPAGELAGEITHVDIHAPCFLAAKCRQGTGMDAEHADAHGVMAPGRAKAIRIERSNLGMHLLRLASGPQCNLSAS